MVNYEMDAASPTMPWSQSVARRLAEEGDDVTVLTQRVGSHGGHPRLQVHRLPFARFATRRFFDHLAGAGACRLVRSLAAKNGDFDACFLHMAAHWVVLLKPALRELGIPSLAWYAHGSVDERLHRVLAAADRVVTSSPEGFRIPTDKVRIIGQGIDTDIFRPVAGPPRDEVLAVSRISPRKRLELLVQAMAVLADQPSASGIRLRLVGAALNRADRAYARALAERVHAASLGDRVVFEGYRSREEIAALHARAFVHVNVSATGSMDKTVLEALACGVPAITSNGSFRGLLADLPECLLESDCAGVLAARILAFHERRETIEPGRYRSLVEGRHDEASWVARVREQLQEIRRR